MEEKIEILAPAGNFEALVAAVENGADAVYLGGKAFNARKSADNFENEKLKEAVDYAHLRGVRVYLTLNILLTNRELEKLTDFLVYIHSIGIDGVIVQDLGVAKFVKEVIPEIKIHASTQMTVHNVEGAKELEKLGFERVVLARELSLDEVRHICENTAIEVEIFVHGALCVCYSGQCLMSSLIGGRSGNRGACAQPCRLQYQIASADNSEVSDAGYLLSPKDICTIRDIDKILESGVKSLKIEGRMKRPEYVAEVIGTYKKYIDKYYENKFKDIDKRDFESLLQVFNRGGFTKGYLFNEVGKYLMSSEKPNNWGVFLGQVKAFDPKTKRAAITLETDIIVGDGVEFWSSEHGFIVNRIFIRNRQIDSASSGDTIELPTESKVRIGEKVYKTSSKRLLDELRLSYEARNIRKIQIDGEVEAKLGEPIEVKITDGTNIIKVRGEVNGEKAINKPLSVEKLCEQLNKLGNTPFTFRKLDIQLHEGVSLPVSEMNNVRRKAIEELSNRRIKLFENVIDIDKVRLDAERVLTFEDMQSNKSTGLSININSFDQVNKNLDVDRIYVPISLHAKNPDAFFEFIHMQKVQNKEIYIAMPRIIKQDIYKALGEVLPRIVQLGIDGFLTTGIGQETYLKQYGLKIYADFSYNVFNNLTIEALKDKDITGITLSPELNLSQIKEVIRYSEAETECIVYGRLPLMISQYCPVGFTFGKNKTGVNCGKCKSSQYKLIDRMKNELPIILDPVTCQSTILNSKVLFLGDELEKVLKIRPSFIRLNMTTEIGDEVETIVNFHREFLKNRRGIIDGYKEYIGLKSDYFTKGHYFRGVE